MSLKEKMTSEQKYWYLKGYIDCFIPDIANDLGITEAEAKKNLGDYLQQTVISKSKISE